MMRKWMLPLMAVLACMAPLSSARDSDIASISVAGANRWYPYSYRLENGAPQGVGYELLERLMAPRGVQVHGTPDKPWGRMLQETIAGQTDALSALYRTPEREEKLWLTTPFATDSIQVFVLKGREFNLQTLRDLEGRIGVRPAQGSYGPEFDKFAREKLTFREVRDVPAQFRALVEGNADYAVYAEFDGLARIRTLGLEGRIIPLGKPVARADVCLGLSRQRFSAADVQAINRDIERLRRDGAINKMMDRHKALLQ